MSNNNSSNNDVDIWLNAIENILNGIESLYIEKHILNRLWMMCHAYVYSTLALDLIELKENGVNISIKPRNTHKNIFVFKLYPRGGKESSYFEVKFYIEHKKTAVTAVLLMNIDCKTFINMIKLNLDIALVRISNKYNNRSYILDTVNKEDVLAFIEVKNQNIYSELYATVIGQYYLIHGSIYKNKCRGLGYLVACGNGRELRLNCVKGFSSIRPGTRLRELTKDIINYIKQHYM